MFVIVLLPSQENKKWIIMDLFQNPLRQNFKHVKALESALQVPADTIHSIVTFVGDTTFKTPMPPNVTYGAEFIRYIKTFKKKYSQKIR